MTRWFGPRRFAALAALPLLLLTGAWSCDGQNAPPAHVPDPQGDAVAAALKACGPGCTIVAFYADLLDNTRNPVKPEEEYPADLHMDAYQAPEGGGSPVNVPVMQYQEDGTAIPKMTPWDHPIHFPFSQLQVIAPSVVQLGMEVEATVPPDWTLQCHTESIGNTVSSHKVTNRSGLPVEMSVFCSYPVDMPDWLDVVH